MAPRLLAVDVSNTDTALVLWPDGGREAPGAADLAGRRDAGALPLHWQIASDAARTPDETRLVLWRLLGEHGLAPADVGASVVACVVPEILPTLVATCHALFAHSPLVVAPGVKSGLAIRTENPREVGPDRIANAVAAVERYGAPALVLDFGTALTVDVVGPPADYLGAIIAPGLEVAAEALARRAARLRRFDLMPPARAVADDTEGGLRSGLVYGYLGLVEGLVRRAQAEVGPATVVATGDAPWLPELLAQTHVVDAYDPLLTLDGLRRIYRRNTAA